jgi:predicted DNA-binding transcriptional regulator YafY
MPGGPPEPPAQKVSHRTSAAESSPARRRGRTARFVELLRVLESERCISRAQVGAILGATSLSSWKRVRAELAALGWPLTYDRATQEYRLAPAATLARFPLDARTRMQLATVRAAIDALGEPFRSALADVLTVLDARIAYEAPPHTVTISSRHPQPPADPGFFERLDLVETAIGERRWLRFRYRKTAGGAPQLRWLAPYAVHVHRGRFYVWGVPEGEPRGKLFALDGMQDVALEDDTFVPDPTLRLDEALHYAFGILLGDGPPEPVVIDVAPEAAAFALAREWPAQTDCVRRADGSVRLAFLVTTYEELVAWVLSFGGLATIVTPPAAREELRRRAERITALAGPGLRN